MEKNNSKYILGTRVDFYEKSNIIDVIDSMFVEDVNYNESAQPQYIFTVNSEFLYDAYFDKEFQNILNKSSLSIADSIGVVIAKEYITYTENNKNIKFKSFVYALFLLKIMLEAFFYPKQLNKYKIPGRSLFLDICKYASKNAKSVYLLGGWPKDAKGNLLKGEYDIASEVSSILNKNLPKINIVGSTSTFGYKQSEYEKTLKYIQKDMHKNKATVLDFIFVAYGHKNQEKWLLDNMKKIPAKFGMGVGGTFDVVSNNIQTPPKFIEKLNIEWLYRLIMQPWRIKRIYKAFILFPILLYKTSLKM